MERIDVEAVAYMYNNLEMSLPEISRLTGWNNGALSRALNRTGQMNRKYVPHNKKNVDQSEATYWIRQGLSTAAVAEKLGVARSVLDRRLKEWGISPNPVGRRPGRKGERKA